MLLIILCLSILAGFSVRRGRICLVLATEEIVEKKPLRTMIFIVQAMAVALSITVPAILFFPDQVQLASSYPISLGLILGAVIYGIGATLNNGCALGSLNSLVNGNLNFLGTVLGLASGHFLFLFFSIFTAIDSVPSTGTLGRNLFFLIPLLGITWGVFGWVVKSFFSKSHDSFPIFCLGLASGALFLVLEFSWSYTRWIFVSERLIFGQLKMEPHFFTISTTFGGFMVGVILATYLSHSFQLKIPSVNNTSSKFFGGSLMGFGAGMIPGGNDTLILSGFPGLSVHAPVAIAIIVLTIALVLKLTRPKA